MNLFETVKTQVTLRQAAERYGLAVGRSGKIRCPFHDDHDPSLKLNENYYYCFGCHASGDVVDFTARLFGLNNGQAALKLVQDFGLARPGLSEAAPIVPTKTFRDRERNALRVLEAHLKLLKLWKTAYEPKAPEEPEDDRYVTACQMMDYDEYLIAELTTGTREEREGKLKILEDDGVIEGAERFLMYHREELGHAEA